MVHSVSSTLLPLLLALHAVASPQPQPKPDPIHVPLTRRAAVQKRSVASIGKAGEHLRAKYGFSQPSVDPATLLGPVNEKRASSSDISITDQGSDSSYFGTVQIGTPAQSLNVILDTGSSDLWVADSSCRTCNSGTPLFDASKSTTVKTDSAANPATTIRYGSGAVAGSLSSDTVTMGGFTIPQQTFLAVDRTTDQLLSGTVSGIMGLAFQQIANTNVPPFWQALANNNQLSTAEMGFWLARHIDDLGGQQENPDGGVLTLGGTNSSLFIGDIEFNNFPSGTEPSFWLQQVSSLTVNGNSVSITTGDSAIAAIDTGTTLIGGPTNDVQAFWKQVAGSGPIDQMPGFFSFPCDTNLNVAIAFGGKTWPINSDDMNLGQLTRGGSDCLGGIFDLTQGSSITPGSGNPNWVVGDVFLKNVYSVYRLNPPSVGFAQLSDAAGGSGAPSSSSSSTAANGSGSSPSTLTSNSNSNSFTPTKTPSIIASSLSTIGTPGAASTNSGSGSGSGALSHGPYASTQLTIVLSLIALGFCWL